MDNQETIEALRRRIEAERAACAPNRVKYSDGIRREVLSQMKRMGWGANRMGNELGVACSVLSRWVQLADDRGRRPRSRSSRSRKMVKVALLGGVSPAGEGFVLEFPSGAKVSGLSYEQVKDLTRGPQ